MKIVNFGVNNSISLAFYALWEQREIDLMDTEKMKIVRVEQGRTKKKKRREGKADMERKMMA